MASAKDDNPRHRSDPVGIRDRLVASFEKMRNLIEGNPAPEKKEHYRAS